MSRYKEAQEVLRRAYEDDRLRSGSYCTCAAAILIENALGEVDTDWGAALTCHLMNLPLPEGQKPITYYAEKTGYSVDELIQIEAAFEGVPIIPGVRRAAMARDESIAERLERVFYVLKAMDGEHEKEKSMMDQVWDEISDMDPAEPPASTREVIEEIL